MRKHPLVFTALVVIVLGVVAIGGMLAGWWDLDVGDWDLPGM